MTSLPRIGIVGGVGWPSTIEYYRAICEGVNRHFADKGGEPSFAAPVLVYLRF
jgi:aspartate racemase